mgnify:CR=1 FL=1
MQVATVSSNPWCPKLVSLPCPLVSFPKPIGLIPKAIGLIPKPTSADRLFDGKKKWEGRALGCRIGNAAVGDAIKFDVSGEDRTEESAQTRGTLLPNSVYARVLERIVCTSYQEMLTAQGRTVEDFLPGEGLSVQEAVEKYRSFTAEKYMHSGVEIGAVAFRLHMLRGP